MATTITGNTIDVNTAVLNRLSTDGNIVDFQKDGTGVGSIGTQNGSDFFITGSAAIATGLRFQANEIVPINASASNVDAAIDIGKSNIRFKDAYLSGGVYLGGTGSANLLSDYESGTWTPYGAGIDASNSVGYYTKVGNVCHTQMWILSDGATNGTISGLPFTAGHTNNAIGVGTVGYISTTGSVTGIVSAGQNTSISLYNGTATGSMASGNQMHCAMTYRTT